MIRTMWPYLAVMLLAAGIFPALERRLRWRLFGVLPPIVLTYLLVTLLAVVGLWQVNDEIKAAQSAATSRLVPALLFLLMVNCDLRAILALGPRILGAFNEKTTDWLQFFMFTYFTDRDGKYQLGALKESAFDPLARSCEFMLKEEAHLSLIHN